MEPELGVAEGGEDNISYFSCSLGFSQSLFKYMGFISPPLFSSGCTFFIIII